LGKYKRIANKKRFVYYINKPHTFSPTKLGQEHHLFHISNKIFATNISYLNKAHVQNCSVVSLIQN